MTSPHLDVQSPPQPRRRFRCLRHSKWMAACTDCRAAHTELLPNRPGTSSQGR